MAEQRLQHREFRDAGDAAIAPENVDDMSGVGVGEIIFGIGLQQKDIDGDVAEQGDEVGVGAERGGVRQQHVEIAAPGVAVAIDLAPQRARLVRRRSGLRNRRHEILQRRRNARPGQQNKAQRLLLR